MASSQRIFTLSLGSQVVRLAEFRTDSKGGLSLTAYQTSELLADPAAEGTRVAQTSLATQELVGALKATGQSVNYAIPAQPVFIRFVKLPAVSEDKIDQIVTFEAQQNVPFPIEEVVWDYQVVPSSDPGKLEVVLSAIKSDLLDELNGAVESAKVSTGVVDVAPMALFNAFRYNYSDISGCCLLIDIGSRTTDLIFIEGKRVFTRTINIGGNTISGAIAKDFTEPFSAAESRKKGCGFVSLGGAYAEPDDAEVARVSKVIRNTMTRLHAEISRSISFYRSQQGGAQPERVYLSGGAVSMPYMREFFSEKLGMSIEFFNPLRNVSVGGSVNVTEIAKEAHVLGELVGLALRSGADCPMELNLRPESVVRTQTMAARRPYLIGAGICLLATLGGFGHYYSRTAVVFEDAGTVLAGKVTGLNGFKTEFSKVEAATKVTQDRVKPLLLALSEREYWVRLIEDLDSRLPVRNIWITELSISTPAAVASAAPRTGKARPVAPVATDPSTVLIVKGLYIPKKDAPATIVSDDFLKNIQESDYFEIDPKKQSEIYPTRKSPDSSFWTAEYGFVLPLKKTIAQ